MKTADVILIDQPREFAVDEIFFSTTDPRGIITSGNEVFVRISGYTPDELIGKAHNIIRHPHMPQAAFRLVWDRLKAGKMVAALVKNRANDGRHYWVVALITPAPNGYLSVRFKPTGPFLAKVEPLYARMSEAEQSARAAGADLAATMDAGARVLEEGLRAAGFADFDSFMRVLLCEELKARDEALVRENRRVVRQLTSDGQAGAGAKQRAGLAEVYSAGCLAYEHLNRLYARLDSFVALNATLDRKSSFVNNLTDELRLASMNVALASSRLGGEGQGLGVISRHMGDTSTDVATAVTGLVSGINTLSANLRVVIFNLAAARLQIEMLLSFVHELVGAKSEVGDRQNLIKLLHEAFSGTMGQASEALHELESKAHSLNAMSHDLERHMVSLQVAQLGGVVESTRLSAQHGFGDIFAHIREQIENTRNELGELGEALNQLDALANETPGIAREIETAAGRMEDDIGRYAMAA